jgi:L-iditol 2-dehydrogenase
MLATHVPVTGEIRLVDWPDPVAREPGQFVVRLTASAICGSDIHAMLEGNMHPSGPTSPGYSGHEGVGVVTATRSAKFAVGDRVLCLPEGRVGGCFAEQMLLDDDHALVLPDGDPWRLLQAQQYGTVVWAMKHFWPTEVPPRQGGCAVVLGLGSAGLFFVQELRRYGFRTVIASDPDPYRRGIAERLGARVSDPQGIAVLVADLTDGQGADLVVEAVGLPETRALSIALARTEGIVGVFGVPIQGFTDTHDVDAAFRKLLRIQYSVNAQAEPGLASFAEALRRVAAAEVEVDYCLGLTYPLADIVEAVRVAEARGSGWVRVLVDCS